MPTAFNHTSKLRFPVSLDATDFPSTFGDRAMATVQETFSLSPTRATVSGAKSLFGFDEGEMIPRHEAKEIVDSLGLDLSFTEDVPRPFFEEQVERAKARSVRQAILASGPNTVREKGSMFMVALAASFVDPVNIAASFVPIVGTFKALGSASATARRLSRLKGVSLAQRSRATTRAGLTGFVEGSTLSGRTIPQLTVRGATEGAVGTALLEPFVMFQASRDQVDYELTDTMLNLAFGTVIGAGFHVAVGKGIDFYKGKRPGVEAESDAQAVEVARNVEVDAVLDELNVMIKRGEMGEDVRAQIEALPIEVRRHLLASAISMGLRDVGPQMEELIGIASRLQDPSALTRADTDALVLTLKKIESKIEDPRNEMTATPEAVGKAREIEEAIVEHGQSRIGKFDRDRMQALRDETVLRVDAARDARGPETLDIEGPEVLDIEGPDILDVDAFVKEGVDEQQRLSDMVERLKSLEDEETPGIRQALDDFEGCLNG